VCDELAGPFWETEKFAGQARAIIQDLNPFVITRTISAVVNPGFTGNGIEEKKEQSKDNKRE
jgi:hypothetical protein